MYVHNVFNMPMICCLMYRDASLFESIELYYDTGVAYQCDVRKYFYIFVFIFIHIWSLGSIINKGDVLWWGGYSLFGELGEPLQYADLCVLGLPNLTLVSKCTCGCCLTRKVCQSSIYCIVLSLMHLVHSLSALVDII